MPSGARIGEQWIGHGNPVFVVAEIGINHNGDLDLAKKLIDAAVFAGCDAVKFQKRTPELCVPSHQRDVPRETPWGTMSYLEYKERIEFGQDEFDAIDEHCRQRGILWFASCWDLPSVDFIERYDPPCWKVASASLTEHALLDRLRDSGRTVILSTGMSTMDEIREAVSRLEPTRLVLTHTNSTYPCKPRDLNLRMIETLTREFGCPVGYSGHETGLQTTLAAVVLGACLIERHVTMDRAMWGTDQAASVEPWGMARLVRDIRVVEQALGDGEKRLYEAELAVRRKLRG
jgi:N-acetylneuraminate synthase